MKTGLFLLLVGLRLAPSVAQADVCPLLCENDSVCKQGSASWGDQPKNINNEYFDFHKDKERDGWFCECAEGWTGLRCGRPVVQCPGTNHYCYHGGVCLEGQNETLPDEHFFCDCSNAEYDGVPYVGKYCELEGAQRCSDTSEVFCLNGGTCKDGFETKSHPCECLPGHRGTHCEFDRGHVPECTLKCENQGKCTLGIKSADEANNYNFWDEHDGNFQHCVCQDGYWGLTCGVEGEKCGDGHCFNGAKCLETLAADGTTTQSCDCRAADTADTSFGGEFCQAESTTFCSDEADQNGRLFCANGGTCLEEAHQGCECPDDFYGPICEFHGDGDSSEDCNLKCENEGVCRKGQKDNSLIDKFGDNLSDYNTTHFDWEHCVCPDGFFGIQCEHQLEICPGGEHVCLHGSKCVPTDETGSGTEHICDCDQGFDAIEKYAGKFCQYTSTDICTIHGKPGAGKANFAFCVNNGKCKKRVKDNERHPGCKCDEGFNGEHCEFLAGFEPTDAPVDDPVDSVNDQSSASLASDGSSNGLLVGLAISLLTLVGFVVVVLARKFLRRRNGKDLSNLAPLPAPEPMKTGRSEDSGDETVDMQTRFSSPEKDLQTIDIL